MVNDFLLTMIVYPLPLGQSQVFYHIFYKNMKTAFLTVFKNHYRIIKSINQRKSSKEQLREGYLTIQVAFS